MALIPYLAKAQANPFIEVNDKSYAITGVTLIDGTGKPALDHQTVIISNGRIQDLGNNGQLKIPQGMKRINGKEIFDSWASADA